MKNKAKWIERQQEIVDAARAAGRGLAAEERAGPRKRPLPVPPGKRSGRDSGCRTAPRPLEQRGGEPREAGRASRPFGGTRRPRW